MAGIVVLAALLRLWRLDLLPPGLFFDEAYNGFDARQILQGGPIPLFFAGNNGREPLFIYLQTVSVALLGATPYALRIVAALTGIVAVPAVYFCAVTLLTPRPATLEQRRAAGWLALVAALGLAVSYWHLSLSRLGFRVNLLVPISALAIAFLWRAWTGRRRADYAWAGVWLGLAMSTYIAARLLPVVILAFVLAELLASLWRARRRGGLWAEWRPRLAGLLLLAGVALAVALPLLWTLLANPALASARTGQVSIWSDASGQWLPRLLDNLLLTARAFYDQGDQNLRHNLPGRPVNDLALAVLFTLGWLSALLTLVSNPRSRLLLLWFAIMLAPTVLSSEAPQYLRSAGALPPLAIFYALGASAFASLWQRAARRPPDAASQATGGIAAAIAVLLLVLAWSGTRTAVDYFQRWASLPGLGAAFDVDKQLAAAAAASLLGDPAQGGRLLMSSEIYLQPQMGYALGPVAAGAAPPAGSAGIPWLQEDSFDPRSSLMLVTRQDGQPISAWLQPLEAQPSAASALLRWPSHQPGWPQVTQALLPAATPLTPRQIRYPLDVTFANGLRLLGYDVEPDMLPSGPDEARLTLFWQEKGAGAQAGEWRSDFDVFAHLNTGGTVAATANGQLRGQALAERLHAGQPMIEDVRLLRAPPDAPPGKAHFEVGLYRYQPGRGPAANERISIVDAAGQAVADQVNLGALWLGSAPAPVDLADLVPLGVEFDGRIRLAGAQARSDPADAQRLLVDLGWQALDRSTTGYTAFVHLLDAAGQIVAQYDAPPGGVDNPTNLWAPGEVVRATFPLALPAGLDSAGLQLRIGLYEPVSGRQLPITGGAAPPVDTSGGLYLLVPLSHLERPAAP